ncbi:hypothetical protein GCM10027404_03950 [Arthrobacter tumbae]|uniref:hypothetical protein n=1 Tax=Arthrobacter tumbae TaxID=163874 RepID=UPI001957B641|nr:hypothetical protein [Arthrobacter tumbae]MBM7780160.1 hypothetical protein [Arthrobacter tumbae]
MAWRDRPLPACAILLVLAPLLAGCRIEVPVSPDAPASDSMMTTAPEPSGDASGGLSELPPLPRADIVGNDMTFDRGSYIEEADTVAFSDGLSRAPGWSQEKVLVNGESVYVSDAGCTASLRSTPPQGPLVVSGNDRASTEALFRFLDPSILPEYLVTTDWLWGASPAESTASIEFLTYVQDAAGDHPASAISLRLFEATGTGLAFIISCPSDEQLTAASVEVRSSISVVPPG